MDKVGWKTELKGLLIMEGFKNEITSCFPDALIVTFALAKIELCISSPTPPSLYSPTKLGFIMVNSGMSFLSVPLPPWLILMIES